MDAKELRIGNLVKSNGFYDRNGVVELKGITTNEKYLETISGIPLTSEWLEKFGFEKDIKSSTYHKVLPDGHLQVETDYSFGICEGTFGGTAYERGNWYSGEFQYVHQLQNLYFALTGEELELKEVSHSSKES